MFPIVAVHGHAIGRGENNTGDHRCTIEVLKDSSGALVGPIRGETGRSSRERSGGALSVSMTRHHPSYFSLTALYIFVISFQGGPCSSNRLCSPKKDFLKRDPSGEPLKFE